MNPNEPELIDFFSSDGQYITTGYFYSPSQLENIRYRRLYNLTPKEIYGEYSSSVIEQKNKEIV